MPVRREILLSVNLTVADSYLGSEYDYLGVSLSKCVVNVSTGVRPYLIFTQET